MTFAQRLDDGVPTQRRPGVGVDQHDRSSGVGPRPSDVRLPEAGADVHLFVGDGPVSLEEGVVDVLHDDIQGRYGARVGDPVGEDHLGPHG